MRRFDQEVTAARRAAKDSVIAIVPMEVRHLGRGMDGQCGGKPAYTE